MGTLTRDLGLLVVFPGLGFVLGSLAYGRLGKIHCFKTIFLRFFSGGMILAVFAFFTGAVSVFLYCRGVIFYFRLEHSPDNGRLKLSSRACPRKTAGQGLQFHWGVMHLAFVVLCFKSATAV